MPKKQKVANRTFNCRASGDLVELLEQRAAEIRETKSVVVRAALRAYFDVSAGSAVFARRNNSGVATAGTPEGSKMGTAGAELAPANLAEGAQ